jgi:hypothetical protein
VWLVPTLIIVLSISGLLGARRISLPTLTFIYDYGFKGKTASAEFIVEGVRCYGTANLLRKHIESVPGIISMIAYGGRHRVTVEYDPARTSREEILDSIEKPVMTSNGPMEWFKVTSSETK